MVSLTIPARGITQGESEGLVEKIENIITLAEDFPEAIRILDVQSLNEKELSELDDLKDRINSHFDFILGSLVYSEEEIKDWLENKDST